MEEEKTYTVTIHFGSITFDEIPADSPEEAKEVAWEHWFSDCAYEAHKYAELEAVEDIYES